MLNAAPAITIAELLMHLAFLSNVHTAETGTHWNEIANTNANVWHICHNNIALVIIRKFLVGKMRI